jgi:hypothetical protein
MVEGRRTMNAPSAASFAGGVTLDALFRANVAARPNSIALADPPNRASFTDGTPLRLTYAQLEERVDRLARKLRGFAMTPGSVVAVQLPNIAESAVSLLAVLRAGYVAAPVPMLWRRSDLIAALAGVSPKAFITLARLNDERPAEIVCEAAAELFDLSFPCAFGENVPDGLVPLDREDFSDHPELPVTRAEASVSLVTFDADAEGFFPSGRSDAQWLAAGLATLLEARIETADTIVTAIPLSSLAGLATAFVPWLLSGGTLQLASGQSKIFGSAGPEERVHVVAPAAVLGVLAQAASAPFASAIAVHRSARTHAVDLSRIAAARVVDFHNFGETGAVVLMRDDPRSALPVPVGGISAPSGMAGAPVVVEAKQKDAQIWLRGPMVPREAYPAGLGSYRTARDADGFVRTGYRCRSDGNGGLIVEAGPDRVVSVGGLRFGLDDLQSRFAAIGEDVKILTVEDPLLGERLRIEAANPEAAAAALLAAGHSQLIVDATKGEFGSRGAR